MKKACESASTISFYAHTVSISTDKDLRISPALFLCLHHSLLPSFLLDFITTSTVATSVILPLRLPLLTFLSTQLTARDAKNTYWAVSTA